VSVLAQPAMPSNTTKPVAAMVARETRMKCTCADDLRFEQRTGLAQMQIAEQT
jgi:hypothetical protein